MRWDPDKHYKELRTLAKRIALHGDDRMRSEDKQFMAQGVLDLIERIKKDEAAISATLEQCDGNLTLASMALHYKAYKKGWERMKKAKAWAQEALIAYSGGKSFAVMRNALIRIAADEDL